MVGLAKSRHHITKKDMLSLRNKAVSPKRKCDGGHGVGATVG